MATHADEPLPGLSYRVHVEHYGLGGVIPDGTTVHHDALGEVESVGFDYLRVSGDSLEDALRKVQAYHQQQVADRLGGSFSVGLAGYNLDGVPLDQPLVLLSFERHGESGWEWEVGEVGPDAIPGRTTRYRTDSRGQGLWWWARGDQQWVQIRGHLQWEAGAGSGAARHLMLRWGLGDRRRQHAAQQGDHDLITADEVVTLLRERGRPLSLAALRNYGRRPPSGWPGVATRVGRTPLWSRSQIEAYAASGR